jgi:hypothetical protein
MREARVFRTSLAMGPGQALRAFRDDRLVSELLHARRVRSSSFVTAMGEGPSSPPPAHRRRIVEANFAPWYYRPEIAHTWLSFCAEAPFKRQPRRLQRVLHQRMQSNFTAN